MTRTFLQKIFRTHLTKEDEEDFDEIFKTWMHEAAKYLVLFILMTFLLASDHMYLSALDDFLQETVFYYHFFEKKTVENRVLEKIFDGESSDIKSFSAFESWFRGVFKENILIGEFSTLLINKPRLTRRFANGSVAKTILESEGNFGIQEFGEINDIDFHWQSDAATFISVGNIHFHLSESTGGASLLLQTYRFDEITISSVLIVALLSLLALFLLFEKFYEAYIVGEREFFNDANRTCCFLNIVLLFFVALNLLSILGTCVPKRYEEQQCYVIDSFKRKALPHEILLACSLFTAFDGTRFFIDKNANLEIKEESKEFFISNYFKYVVEKILARFDMGSDAAEEEIKRCFDAMKESKQVDFLKLQEELKEEAQGKQDKLDEVMDLFVVNALEHEIARLKYQQAVREEVDKLRPYFLTTKKFVHFLKRIERIEQLIFSVSENLEYVEQNLQQLAEPKERKVIRRRKVKNPDPTSSEPN
ncbi:Oidioi.mRNA.OKI2018_I69.chr2.g5376.t1.cds [Oikopleura dioica]|uniref:Oidioi.mRNA.OKI2018_I69.chr2.g5376.t1.cds n=1 Tax=Oikopleura dioica TaxID=34765 RepID=A0ABN7T043_OIKDI|nr:Oidioi.mRNA.OKI2018_I69.chr2.g5376.t1.cds [Oikopleura dioica]